MLPAKTASFGLLESLADLLESLAEACMSQRRLTGRAV